MTHKGFAHTLPDGRKLRPRIAAADGDDSTDGCSIGDNCNVYTAPAAEYDVDITWQCRGYFGGKYDNTTEEPYRCEVGSICEGDVVTEITLGCEVGGTEDCTRNNKVCKTVDATTAQCVPPCTSHSDCDSDAYCSACGTWANWNTCSGTGTCESCSWGTYGCSNSGAVDEACGINRKYRHVKDCSVSCSNGECTCSSHGDCGSDEYCSACGTWANWNTCSGSGTCKSCAWTNYCRDSGNLGRACSRSRKFETVEYCPLTGCSVSGGVAMCNPSDGRCTRHRHCSQGGLTTGGSDGEYCNACTGWQSSTCSGTGTCQSCTWNNPWCNSPPDEHVRRTCKVGTTTRRIDDVEICDSGELCENASCP